MVVDELLMLVKANKPPIIYRATQIATEHGHCVYFTPPYHPELQPIELIWAQIKNKIANDPASKMEELERKIRAAVTQVDSTDWVKAFRHVQKFEDKYLALTDDSTTCPLTSQSGLEGDEAIEDAEEAAGEDAVEDTLYFF